MEVAAPLPTGSPRGRSPAEGSLDVAVIGAGAAGLVTAHELLRAGHNVAVFEASQTVGGLWNYDPRVEDDPLGQQPSARIRSSLYASLRVNLPRDLMAFEGYTFDSAGGGGDRWPRYPHHTRVLEYLRRFATDMGVSPHVRLGHRVRDVTRVSATLWQVDGQSYDAVAICNGHFTEPIVPAIPGFGGFPGTALHSHNYRRPDALAGARVVLLGSSVSGHDLAREIATVAQDVYLSGRLFTEERPLACQEGPVKRCPPVVRFNNTDVVLASGEVITDVDAFIFCTGYHYRFPFLARTITSVYENWVQGLYRQLMPVEVPRCAFIGLPFRIVPLPLFQRQARWFARSLSGDFPLPGLADRRREYADDIARLSSSGIARRHYHRLGTGQIAYLNGLAEQCGDDPVPDWFVALWQEHNANAHRHPGDYRDRPLVNQGPSIVA